MPESNQEICNGSDDEVKLIFACSGAADVGHLSDLAVRQMMKEGCGKMFCLAGLGGQVSGIVETTKGADKILVIDGCPLDCAKKTIELAGINTYQYFRVTDLGFEKGKSPINNESIQKISEHGKTLMC